MKKGILAAATFFVASSAAWAATFSAGGGAGTSIVDANGTGDYTSLAAAAADFTGFAGGATGNWNLLIRSDLNETTSSVFGNDSKGHTITVRPAPGTSVTVTFEIPTRPLTAGGFATWDGNILIGPDKNAGSDDSANANPIRYTELDNFIIDGCNTPGGTARNLSFVSLETEGAAIPRNVIRVVGGVFDSVIRNCTFVLNEPGQGGEIAIQYNSRGVGGSLNYVPQRPIVRNVGIEGKKGGSSRGIYSVHTGTTSLNIAIEGMVVTDNDIEVGWRAVQFGGNAGGEISNNRIKVNQSPLITGDGSSLQRPEVIIHTGANGSTTGWTTNIIGNHISQIHTLNTGGLNYAIYMRTDNAESTFNVINNMIGGYEAPAALPSTAQLARGIAFETGTNPGTYNIRHNSISMDDLPGLSNPDTTQRLSGLSFFNVTNFTGTVNFENNIFSYRQHNGSLISGQAGGVISGTLNSNNNTYHLANGALFAEISGVAYNTLADWKSATGRDADSNEANPFAPPTGGAWISDSNQHWNAEPAVVFDGVAIAGITTDIDGDPRPTPPTKGADEFTVTTTVGNWMLY